MEINMGQARQLTIAFLRDWMNKLPVAQRTGPAIMFDMRSWNVPEMLAQVTMNTAVGQRYVSFYIESLKNYVVRG